MNQVMKYTRHPLNGASASCLLPRPRFGLTLIEMLMSLVILSSLMGIVIPWLQLTSQLQHRILPQHKWQAAANAVLHMIRDDLVISDALSFSDLQDSTSQTGYSQPRVLHRVDALTIQTRARLHLSESRDSDESDGGPVIRRYVYEPTSNELRMRSSAFPLTDLQQRPSPRDHTRTSLLMTGVASFRCTVITNEIVSPSDHPTKGGRPIPKMLIVSITDLHGLTVSSTYSYMDHS